MHTDGEDARRRNPRERYPEAESREHRPELTIGSEKEECCTRRHESRDSEYGNKEKSVAECVHAARGLSARPARGREADADRCGRDEEGDEVPDRDHADLTQWPHCIAITLDVVAVFDRSSRCYRTYSQGRAVSVSRCQKPDAPTQSIASSAFGVFSTASVLPSSKKPPKARRPLPRSSISANCAMS